MRSTPHAYVARALPLPPGAPAKLLEASPTRFKHVISLSMADGGSPPPSLRTSAVTFYTDEYLVILFEGSFATLREAPPVKNTDVTRKTPMLWETADVFEFFVGSGARVMQSYREFQVAPDGRWLDLSVLHQDGKIVGDDSWHSGCRCSSFVDIERKTWRSLLQIPWTSLGEEPPANANWRCNYYRASGRFHGDQLLAWSPTGIGPGCFHRTEHFGTLVIQR